MKRVKRTPLKVIIALIMAFLAIGTGVYLMTKDKPSGQEQGPQAASSSEPRVLLRADDNTVIAVRPFLVKGAKIGAVIIHDIDKDRTETMQFAEDLAKACKCSTVAVDLRGHGQSEGETDDFTNMHRDAEVAEKYLRLQEAEKLFYVGFGFGARIALEAGGSARSSGVVLVSPDSDDKGVSSAKLIIKYRGRVLIAASETDADSNRIASKLFSLSQVKDRQYAEFKTGGHGIEMVYNTDLGKIIKDWLIKN